MTAPSEPGWGGVPDAIVVDPGEVPTVLLTGVATVDHAAAFLRLGAVVVIAPDRRSLRRWQRQQNDRPIGDPVPPERERELEVDLRGHAIRWRGRPLPITELEFRVLAALAIEPERAWAFDELRATGWGPSSPTRDDLFTVRSVVQRLRTKLMSAGVHARIESVRGFGFRLSMQPTPPRSVPDLPRSEVMTS
jgi:DNA-binding response OmpR family regulator